MSALVLVQEKSVMAVDAEPSFSPLTFSAALHALPVLPSVASLSRRQAIAHQVDQAISRTFCC